MENIEDYTVKELMAMGYQVIITEPKKLSTGVHLHEGIHLTKPIDIYQWLKKEQHPPARFRDISNGE